MSYSSVVARYDVFCPFFRCSNGRIENFPGACEKSEAFPGCSLDSTIGTIDGVQNFVNIFVELSSLLDSCRELRQGDEFSSLLFNIALENIMRRAELDCHGAIFMRFSQFVCFTVHQDLGRKRQP